MSARELSVGLLSRAPPKSRNFPSLLTMVALARPPEETISVPPSLMVAPISVPPCLHCLHATATYDGRDRLTTKSYGRATSARHRGSARNAAKVDELETAAQNRIIDRQTRTRYFLLRPGADDRATPNAAR